VLRAAKGVGATSGVQSTPCDERVATETASSAAAVRSSGSGGTVRGAVRRGSGGGGGGGAAADIARARVRTRCGAA